MKAIEAKRSRPASVRFPPCGIYVAESRHADDFRMETTAHSFAKILYVGEGEGTLVTERGRWPLRPGRIAIVPAGMPHRICDVPRRPLSLYFLCVRKPALATAGAALGECRIIGHPPLGGTVRRLFQDLLYEQTAGIPGAELFVTGRVLELCGLLLRWKSRDGGGGDNRPQGRSLSRARVEEVVAETGRRFYHPHSLERAAARAGLKPRRFSQVFRQIVGEPWPAFLREKRVGHAKRLLAETNRSVIAVCFECGFDDLSSFYRAFKRMEGTSPLAWRRAHPGAATPR